MSTSLLPGEWVAYVFYMTGATLAATWLSQVNMMSTLSLYTNGFYNVASGFRDRTPWISWVFSLCIHVTLMGLIGSQYNCWVEEVLNDSATTCTIRNGEDTAYVYTARTRYAFYFICLFFANNALGLIFRLVTLYYKERKNRFYVHYEYGVHLTGVVVWFFQHMIFIAFMVLTCVYMYTESINPDTDTPFIIDTGIKQYLAATCGILLGTHFIVNMLPYGRIQCMAGPEGEKAEKSRWARAKKAASDIGNPELQKENDQKKGKGMFIGRALAGAIKTQGHLVPDTLNTRSSGPISLKASLETKDDKAHLYHSSADSSKVFGAGIGESKIIEHYNATVLQPLSQGKSPEILGDALTKLGNGEDITINESNNSFYVMSAPRTAVINRLHPLKELNQSTVRSNALTKGTLSMQLAGVSNTHMSLFQLHGTKTRLYNGNEDLWGCFIGDANWCSFNTDVIITFCIYLYGFYLYFTLDNRSALSLFLITALPALIGSISSKSGYFWDHFSYTMFIGLSLVLLAADFNTTNAGTKHYWFVRDPQIWDSVNITGSSFAWYTEDLARAGNLKAVAYTAFTLSLMTFVSSVRKLSVARGYGVNLTSVSPVTVDVPAGKSDNSQ